MSIASCLAVTFFASEHLRQALGEEHLIIHVLTLLTIALVQGQPPEESRPSSRPASHRRSSSNSSSGSSGSARSLSSTAATHNGYVLAQTQALRCLANLCIDNDENRSHLLLHDTPLYVLKLVKDVLAGQGARFDDDTLILVKTAMGALLNLQLEHSEARRWLLKLPNPRKHHHAHAVQGHRSRSADELSDNDPVRSPSEDERKQSPFALEETETISILVSAATDKRIYTPALALRSLFGAKDRGCLTDRNWTSIVLGAETASWAARVAEDLLAFETEELRSHRAASEAEEPILWSPNRTAMASDDTMWTKLLRPLTGFCPTETSSQTDGTQASNVDTCDDASPLVDADLAIVAVCGDLLESCSHISKGQDNAARAFKRNGLARLSELLDFIEDAASPIDAEARPSDESLDEVGLEPDDIESLAKEVGRAKSNAVKAAVAIAGEDDNLSELFGDASQGGSLKSRWFLERMRAWLKDRQQRSDLVSCALLSIANLARSDDNCVTLVQDESLVPSLVSLLREEGSMLLTHGALGLIKNLSIPPVNKVIIGGSGVIEVIPQFLSKQRDQAQPIQFAAVGLAKHLAYSSNGGVESNVVAICGVETSASTLESLLSLIARTEDVPTRLESTRVLVNLIRTLWSRPAASSSTSQLESAKVRLSDARVVQALSDMIRRSAKYPVLINEGLVGLTLLASGRGGQASSSNAAGQASNISHALLGHEYEGAGGAKEDGAEEEEGNKAKREGGRKGSDESSRSSPSSEAADTPDSSLAPQTKRSEGPQRSGTADSAMSTYSSATATTSPETASDILYDVLARPSDESRCPLQFAENACVLLATLATARQGNGDGVQSLAMKMLPALRGLKSRAQSSGAEGTVKAVVSAIETCERVAF